MARLPVWTKREPRPPRDCQLFRPGRPARQNPIDRRQYSGAVGNDNDRGATGLELGHRSNQLRLAHGVEMGIGLVQQDIEGLPNRARAIATRWACPAESPLPPSWIIVS